MEAILIPAKKNSYPWYREPWVWLVISGPLLVIIAGVYTMVLAFQGADKVIAPDYYKRGLAINKDIRRDLLAGSRKIAADVQLDAAAGVVILHLQGEGALPDTLSLQASRAIGSGNGEIVVNSLLHQTQPGEYRGRLAVPAEVSAKTAALWHVNVESSDWRISSSWHGALQTALQIKAGS